MRRTYITIISKYKILTIVNFVIAISALNIINEYMIKVGKQYSKLAYRTGY